MIPKIEFRYSYVYDKIYRDSCDVKDFLEDSNKKYPSKKDIVDFINKIKIIWKNDGAKILSKISDLCGIKWEDDKIVCYVVGFCRPMSDPLTVKFCRDVNHAIDIITHELIHKMQSQIDSKKWNKWLKFLSVKYPNESEITKSHIFLNAVHKKIYLDLFNKFRFERDVENSKISMSYRYSWRIVDRWGYEEIIKKFREI